MSGQYEVDLERKGDAIVDEGIHAFSITGFDEGQKKDESGEPAPGSHPYWRFDCACLTPGQEGLNASLFLSLSPAARWRMELFLDAVGAPEEGAITADKFMKRKFRAKVVHKDYQGKPQADLAELFSLKEKKGTGAVAKITPSKVSSKPTSKKKAKPGKVEAAALPSDATEDDIEFEGDEE